MGPAAEAEAETTTPEPTQPPAGPGDPSHDAADTENAAIPDTGASGLAIGAAMAAALLAAGALLALLRRRLASRTLHRRLGTF